ncbi:MAG: energy transducer TonB [Acidobacteriota bacterium]
MAKRLNLLNNVKVAAPCSMQWSEMTGNDQVRLCSQCNLNVYNLSAMTSEQAKELLRRTEGNLCVRFYQRSDGTVLTQNCPVGLKAIKKRVAKWATAAASAILTFVVGVNSSTLYQSLSSGFSEEKINLELPQPPILPPEYNVRNLTENIDIYREPVMGKLAPQSIVTEPSSQIERSEVVIRGLAIHKVAPQYPPLARVAKVSGDAMIGLTIDEEGKVTSAHVISGHPLLQKAALDAAREWYFQPTLLNNTPMKVKGSLTFRFVL